MPPKPTNANLAARITASVNADGSVTIPPRIARWLDQQSGLTADRRIRLLDTDPEAYVALGALHLSACGYSGSGTNPAAGQPNQPDWVGTEEAAQAFGVTDRCIRKWCASGRLPSVRVGRQWLIDRNALDPKNIAA
ncbi:helix-turn-helix domain-containing protein [Tsukamurella tyrosinosolvens]|uniref:helix-turn-helix domain-containing protein n=1 Tax=Tsukamurella tyrosinosolvens TaxID=57704 RepID=UPI0009EF13AC|nr:helix-turn-helix domain-containing protein [Tsukamurella tyrosinosolvens]